MSRTDHRFGLGFVATTKADRSKGVDEGQCIVVHKVTDQGRKGDLLLFQAEAAFSVSQTVHGP